MKLLIGDDDAASNQEIVKLVQASGHEAVSAATDEEVAETSFHSRAGRPNFAILNSSTQNLHGLDICKKFRAVPSLYYTYFVLNEWKILTGRNHGPFGRGR